MARAGPYAAVIQISRKCLRPEVARRTESASRRPSPDTHHSNDGFRTVAESRAAWMLRKTKNPGLEAGAFRSAVRRLGSVLGDQRAAKLVVQASGEEIDVLLDAVGLRERGGDEVDVLAIHEHVVVFERDRPVRREAVFEAGANHGTPTGVAGRGKQPTAAQSVDLVLVVGDSGTALRVEQHVVPGVADLAGQ